MVWLALLRASLEDSVLLSIKVAVKVGLSMFAVQSRGSVRVRLKPVNTSFDATVILLFPDAQREFGRASPPRGGPVRGNRVEFVDFEKVDAPAAGAGLAQLFVVGGFDRLAHQ
ncbi:hypothetical protein ACFVW1_41850 [Streptomyces olivochromogenes]|uniref:hypothetical protein n=1 Tax=Streptomyces olivochromogenes TaxID=1963 RepID=UPI0036DFA1DE